MVQNAERTYFCADAQCLSCGAYLGEVIGRGKWLAGSVAFQPANESQGRLVQDWRRLRCPRCGGAPYLEEAEGITADTLARALSTEPYAAAV